MPRKGFTPTERRILDVLSDGMAHRKEDLKLLIYKDGVSSKQTMSRHVSNIRAKLPPGQTIVCEVLGYAYYYRHVRLLNYEE